MPEGGLGEGGRAGHWARVALLELCFTEEVSGGVDSEMRGCARCGGMHGATLLELCFSEEVRGSVESGMCRCVQKCRGCEVLGRGVMPNFLLELCNA